MIRSKAPSQLVKWSTVCNKSEERTSINKDESKQIRKSRQNEDENVCVKKVKFQPTDEKDPSKQNIRVYNVVYGKQSTKKHKTWEEDGILEVGIKFVTLKGSDGKVIGQTSYNTSALDEGSRLLVGSKEVEVIDLVEPSTSFSSTCSLRQNNESNKTSTQVTKVKNYTSVKKKKAPFVFSERANRNHYFQAPALNEQVHFVMPNPDEEHQWVYNTSHLPTTKVVVDGSLAKILRPHQKEGVSFLYKCVTGIRDIKQCGVILGDEMGLGKTLQCITLIWTLLKQGPYGSKPLLKRVLIVVPSSLSNNWNNEFNHWLGSHKILTFVVDKKNKPVDYKKMSHIPIVIISYEMLIRGFEEFQGIQFDLIICDEGHRLKNSNIRTATILNQIQCKRRIILTGTPVQNDLQEFYSLVEFVNPGILGSLTEFRKNFEEIIVASREPNSSEEIILKGAEKAEFLNKLTSGFILRRTQDVINAFLPQKHEYVVFCEPSLKQKTIYTAAIEYWSNIYLKGVNSTEHVSHLSLITAMKKICNHPILLHKSGNENNPLSSILTSALDEEDISETIIEDSNKMCVVLALLHYVFKRKEKVILASSYTQTLELLAGLCFKNGFKYMQFDGSTPVSKRNEIVKIFNNTYSDILVLLLSSKAGGIGLNLIGGCRLVLVDSDWNPATDIQTMARIWREGQKKNVYIYRLLNSGTIEEKIFQRQLNKAGLNESIVDTNCISDVKFSNEELKDLFTYIEGKECLIHEALECKCMGKGEIPQSEEQVNSNEKDEDDRDCKLLVKSLQSHKAPTLRINQLFKWEHHSKPISLEILKEMGMEEVKDKINFVFRNKTV